MKLPRGVLMAAKKYNAWIKWYKPTYHEASAESVALCQGLDERLVWTFHLHTEGQLVTNGFWNNHEAMGFYVSEIPWSGRSADTYYPVEIYDTCNVCNGGGGDCDECYGQGSKAYFVD